MSFAKKLQETTGGKPGASKGLIPGNLLGKPTLTAPSVSGFTGPSMPTTELSVGTTSSRNNTASTQQSLRDILNGLEPDNSAHKTPTTHQSPTEAEDAKLPKGYSANISANDSEFQENMSPNINLLDASAKELEQEEPTPETDIEPGDETAPGVAINAEPSAIEDSGVTEIRKNTASVQLEDQSIATDDSQKVVRGQSLTETTGPKNGPATEYTSLIDLSEGEPRNSAANDTQPPHIIEPSVPVRTDTEVVLEPIGKSELAVEATQSSAAIERSIDSDTDIPEYNEKPGSPIKASPETRKTKRSQSSTSLQPSSKPKSFDFTKFLEILRTKRAEPIAKYIRSFLISFSKKQWTVSEQVKLISDFKKFMSAKFDEFEPFSTMASVELENCHEGLEKLIMNKLYSQCFSPKIDSKRLDQSHREDLTKDEVVKEKLKQFSWVELAHLDIHFEESDTFIDMAIGELSKINNYRAPRDKIIVLLNCCKIIFGYLKQTSTEGSADSFIPVLIYIILKSKIPHFVSNINYIERFRDGKHLSGENAYYLSSLQGAVNFIETLDKDGLTVSEEEFDLHFAEYLQREEDELAAKEQEERRRKLEAEAPMPQRLIAGIGARAEERVSPSGVLFSSAQILGNSISSFLSPPASSGSSPRAKPIGDLDDNDEEDVQERQAMEASMAHRKDAFTSTYRMLRSMFPDLDKDIVKELVVVRQGNIGDCIDVCLELTNGN